MTDRSTEAVLDAARTAAAELEIRNVLASLAHLADSGEVGEYLSCFTEDAVWEMPANPAVGLEVSVLTGRAELEAGVMDRRAAGLQGPGSNSRHVVTTVEVTLERPDVATARAYWLFYVDTQTAPLLRSMGSYDDVYSRTPAGWRLARRTITIG
jgi:3-phenylpropionate/cinnamic acid dioxygenase small subunit